VRERRKEPREGSEIDPETACIQTVGAPALMTFISLDEQNEVLRIKRRIRSEIFIKSDESWGDCVPFV
jgi:hypothetical protein